MIILNGTPFDIFSIIHEYKENSVEAISLQKMAESQESYQYDSLEELKFELGLRKEIVNAAINLNSSAFSFAIFHKSKCNPLYWDRTANGGFNLKGGVSAADAIQDIYQNGHKYATECATAMLIVYYKALLSVFTKNKFDKQFPTIYLMNWQIIEPLLKETGIQADFLPGDRGYFDNPDVNPETPELQGENVIILLDERYYGHGIGIAKADTIIQVLNSNRKRDAQQSAYFMNTVSRPDFKKIAKVYFALASHTTALVWKPFPTPI